MSRPSLVASAVALIYLAPALSAARAEKPAPGAPRAAPAASSVPAALHPVSVLPPTHLAALPPGTAPVALVSSPPAPASAITRPFTLSAPMVSPGDVPFQRSAFASVFVRSQPGTALRYVTPGELASRRIFAPSLPLNGVNPGLAPDEAVLACTLPERPAPFGKGGAQ